MAQRKTSLGFASDPAAALTTGLENDPMNPASPNPNSDANAWDSFSPAAPQTSDGVDPSDPYGVANPRKSYVDAKQNPLQAIGTLLLDVGRGIQGKPLYSDELRRQRLEEEQINMQKMQLSIGALSNGLKLIKSTPAAQRAEVANVYSRTVGHALGDDFSNIMAKAAEAPDNSEAFVNLLGENGKDLLALTGGDYDAAMKLAQDDKFVAQLQNAKDKKLGSQLQQSLAGLDQQLAGHPEYETATSVMKDGWTTAEARQNPEFMKLTGITSEMLDAADRNPGIATQLAPTGFKSAAQIEKDANQQTKSVFDQTTGKLSFATDAEIKANPNLLPAEAKPDKPNKPDFEGGLMAVNPKSGEVLDSPVTFDGNANKYTLADGSPLPAGYIVTRATVQAAKAGDLGGLSKGAQAKTENDVIALNDSLANLEKVQKSFKPEYLEIAPNLAAGTLSTFEKAGMKLDGKQKDRVERFATFKQDAIQGLNEGIKAITGQAMTDTEATRLRKQFPDVENDGPSQFKSKVDNSLDKTKLAIARRQWFIEHGVTVDFKDSTVEPPVSLEGYRRMVNDRGPGLTEKAMSSGIESLSAEEVAALKIYRQQQRNGSK